MTHPLPEDGPNQNHTAVVQPDRQLIDRWLLLYAGLPGRLVIGSETDGFAGHFHDTAPDGLAAAGDQLETLGTHGNTYLRVTTVDDTVTTGRGSADTTRAVIGLWADLDHAAGDHKRHDLPPTPEHALDLLAGLPEPSLIINSGGGFYPWWFFDEPWIIDTPDDLAAVKTLARGWNQIIVDEAKTHGWHVDHVGDLPRILRVPGLLNHKTDPPRPVTVHRHDGTRYPADKLTEIVENLQPAPQPAPQIPVPARAPGGDVPLVDDIKARWTAVSELTARGLPVRPGSKINCPLPGHDDHSPSFHIYNDPDEGWACFGGSCPSNRTGAAGGGSVIDLVMWLDDIDLEQAIQLLAGRIGRTPPATGPNLVAAPNLPDSATPDSRTGGLPYEPGRHPLNDLGNAKRFVAAHGNDTRYVYPFRSWIAWDNGRWASDAGAQVAARAQHVTDLILAEALALDPDQRGPYLKWAKTSGNNARLNAVLEVARPMATVDVDQLDARRWEINTPSGIVDLRTGSLAPHDREKLHTKITGAPYQPDAAAPVWETFLAEVLPDPDVRAFFQRLAGAAAAGVIREHVLPIHFGVGSNGKSTAVEAVSAALGDYAKAIGVQALMDGKRNPDGAAPEIAGLRGTRLAVAQEPELGAKLRESTVKTLTGGDRISARRLYQDPIEFDPTHSLWLVTNHKPIIRGTDEGIWRRIALIPWTVIIPPERRDATLPDRLRSELPGILSWIVEGAISWARDGLEPPAAVEAATSGYRAESDRLQPWIEDRCRLADDARGEPAQLYADYEKWCHDVAEDPVNKHTFYMMLTERGFDPVKSNGRRVRRGIELSHSPAQQTLTSHDTTQRRDTQ